MHSYIKSLSNTIYIKTGSSFKAVQFRIEYQISVLNFKRISNSVFRNSQIKSFLEEIELQKTLCPVNGGA